MNYKLLIGLGVGLFCLVLSLFLLFLKMRKSDYQAKDLLTENEKEFFFRLKRALSDYQVFAQVAMGAIMNPAVSQNSCSYHQIRARFAQKIVDYVICDPHSLRVIAIVELDDCTHNPIRDQRRDGMLSAAGYRVIRWDSRHKPSEAQILREVRMGGN